MRKEVCPYCNKCVVDSKGYCDRHSCNMKKLHKDKNSKIQKRAGE